MKAFVRSLFPAAMIGCCWGVAMAENVSVVGQWKGKYPIEKIVNDKRLWDQPGVLAAMRAAMGERLFALSQKKATHSPEAPVASDGKGGFAAWSCNDTDDCAGNNMTVFFAAPRGSAARSRIFGLPRVTPARFPSMAAALAKEIRSHP
jgi:hypothetical protein